MRWSIRRTFANRIGGTSHSCPVRKPPFDGEVVRLDQLCSKGKSSLRQKDIKNDGPYLVYGASGVVGRMSVYQNERPYVAVVKDGAGVGRAMLCKGKTSVLGTMQALLPNEGTSLSYLLHLVRSLNLGRSYSGSTIPHIYFKDYGKREVTALPSTQQALIAERFDSIERLIAIIDERFSKLDELVKSRFVEMFGDPDENVLDLAQAQLGDILSAQPRNGLYKPQSAYRDDGEGRPIVRIDSFEERWPGTEGLRRLDCTEAELKRYGLYTGDIVINRVNSVGNMGKSMCVGFLPEPTVFESNMMRLRPDESKLLPEFLDYELRSPYSKAYFETHAKRAIGQASINQTDVKSLTILLPSIAAQCEFLDFAARVDKLRFGRAKC
jgi:type I restriction enzyme S subunit